MDAGNWTWLELAKLVASLFIPMTLAIFGIYIHRVTKRFEHIQWRSQKLIEKRLAIYDDLAPQFNDLMCYFTYVGCWKELNPLDVVALKRKLDKKIHLASPLLSPTFFEVCQKFQSLCFETYTGWGQDARLKTQFQRRKEARKDWIEEWELCFSGSEACTNPQEIKAAYANIMKLFAEDIGVHPSFLIPNSGRVPSGVQ
ncbi:MAG: hypothetical protein PHU06_00570 [Gallionella sp.]|nr:hypothetical protein [Gallionella sp.]MDD4957763.1 hypothetical protein [Gallionella sp.]